MKPTMEWANFHVLAELLYRLGIISSDAELGKILEEYRREYRESAISLSDAIIAAGASWSRWY